MKFLISFQHFTEKTSNILKFLNFLTHMIFHGYFRIFNNLKMKKNGRIKVLYEGMT